MTSREKIKKIFDRSSTDGIGFWTGNPHADTEKKYLEELEFDTIEQLYSYLNDDCRWIWADYGYKHPEGKPMFDIYSGQEKTHLGQAGFFAESEDPSDVDKFEWPKLEYLDFTETYRRIDKHQDKMVFTGFWCPFFHYLCDFFGMENYFMKMYTHPEVVEAVTEKVVGFLEEANDLFFEGLGDRADTFFFGNDFGTQLSLLISPDSFQKYVLPGFKRMINAGKKHNKKILLHSCGSIYRVIPLLIDAGIDALHPLQAKAADMDAETLSREFKNDIAFVGGVDTQDLLIHATPQQIKDEVRRLRDLLGPNFVVSPSHEAVLPNVPLENMVAMTEAARE